MSDIVEPFDDGEFLAADYVLGTLGAAERLGVERRVRRDAAFRDEVEEWEGRLAPLAAAVEPLEPRAGLWREIEAGLPPLAAAPVAAPAPARAAPEREGLVPAFWRWLAIGSSGLAAASLAGLVFFAQPVPDTAAMMPMTAAIASDDGLALFAAVVDPNTNSATLVPIRLEMEAGQVPQLWLVPDGGTPHSLGLLDPTQPLRIDISAEMMGDGMMTGGTLAISLEPEGGSPTGQPTGPVVGHGALRSI